MTLKRDDLSWKTRKKCNILSKAPFIVIFTFYCLCFLLLEVHLELMHYKHLSKITFINSSVFNLISQRNDVSSLKIVHRCISVIHLEKPRKYNL